MMRLLTLMILLSGVGAVTVAAGEPDVMADSLEYTLDEVVVARRQGVVKMQGALNADLITSAELARAACCNLGESFTTNPSVDVSYTDAATGARQIRLLGLSGSYVQMMVENIPNLRGAAAPFGLGYMPGPWMASIQVSKGASSVKNGYESMTGQINIEMKKPQADPSLSLNGYVDHEGRMEFNALGNMHLSAPLSAGLMVHAEHSPVDHDMNHDGFADMPRVSQVSLLNRWAYMGRNYVLQAVVKGLAERRRSGQTDGHAVEPYRISVDTRRAEAFVKQAYIFDRTNGGNVALVLSGNIHDMDSRYGRRVYDVVQRSFYSQAMFERNWATRHALSAGVSFTYDDYRQRLRATHDAAQAPVPVNEREAVSGVYGQYTLTLDETLTAMAGVRYDYNSLYGHLFTPRFHVKYTPVTGLTLHASAGRGYRSPHPLTDCAYVLASSRRLVIADNLDMEESWNTGTGLSAFFTLAGKNINVNAEYYYTRFSSQTILDLEDATTAVIRPLQGRSRSHAAQFDVSTDLTEWWNILMAYRLTDVRADYGLKPLTSRHKGLLTMSFTPMMGLWQADVTLALNGGGRLPGDMGRYHAWPSLNVQLTRNFRHWAVYIGGENLTNYRQPLAVRGADDPWGPGFDTTVVYGPTRGAMAYVGFRYNFTKY